METVSISEAQGEAIPQGVSRVDYASSADGTADWALAWPGDRRDLWVVVIHGHGSQGDQLYVRRDIRDAWLAPFRSTGAGILTPNLRGNAWMCPAAAEDLHELLRFVRSEWGMGEALLCSGSMGGTSNLAYAALHPADVQGVVARGAVTDLASYWRWCLRQDRPVLQEIARAIAGAYGGSPDEAPEVYQRHSALENADRLTMPVYLAHGAADATIPVDQARALAERLSGKSDFLYREIPGGNHDSPLRETEGLQWVLDQMAHTR